MSYNLQSSVNFFTVRQVGVENLTVHMFAYAKKFILKEFWSICLIFVHYLLVHYALILSCRVQMAKKLEFFRNKWHVACLFVIRAQEDTFINVLK